MSQTYPYYSNQWEEWERSTINKCRSNYVTRIKIHAEAFEEKIGMKKQNLLPWLPRTMTENGHWLDSKPFPIGNIERLWCIYHSLSQKWNRSTPKGFEVLKYLIINPTSRLSHGNDINKNQCEILHPGTFWWINRAAHEITNIIRSILIFGLHDYKHDSFLHRSV